MDALEPARELRLLEAMGKRPQIFCGNGRKAAGDPERPAPTKRELATGRGAGDADARRRLESVEERWQS